jgi:hypothetical protein
MKSSRLSLLVLLLSPAAAQAGMPTVTLSDMARLRVENLSFFLAGYLLASWLIQRLWNSLRADFTRLPRLSYPKALGVVALWGVLFVLVLTMISGARELLTPGAWEKQGRTYRLAKDPAPPAAEPSDGPRYEQLQRLQLALWEYAHGHGGRFPPDRSAPEVPAERWQTPDPSRMRYVYVPGATTGGEPVPLAYEPEVYGPERLVLLTNGEIRRMAVTDVLRALPGEER